MSPIAPSRQTSSTVPSQRDIPNLNQLGLAPSLVRAITRVYNMVYDVRDLVFTQNGQSCLVFSKNVLTSLSSSTPTAISFDTAQYDTAGAWRGSGTQLQIQQPGVYGIWGTGSFAASGAGTFRQVFLRVNGSLALATSTFGATAGVFGVATSWRFVKGDYVELVQQQDTGGALNNQAGQAVTNFGIVKLTN